MVLHFLVRFSLTISILVQILKNTSFSNFNFEKYIFATLGTESVRRHTFQKVGGGAGGIGGGGKR